MKVWVSNGNAANYTNNCFWECTESESEQVNGLNHCASQSSERSNQIIIVLSVLSQKLIPKLDEISRLHPIHLSGGKNVGSKQASGSNRPCQLHRSPSTSSERSHLDPGPGMSLDPETFFTCVFCGVGPGTWLHSETLLN